jgi:hypothetical protein
MKLPLESLPKFSQNYSVGHGFTASCHRRRGVSKAVRAAEAVKTNPEKYNRALRTLRVLP